jgi:hypothetical protein
MNDGMAKSDAALMILNVARPTRDLSPTHL